MDATLSKSDALLTTREAAELLSCSAGTVRNLEKSGALPAIRFQGLPRHCVRFSRDDVARALSTWRTH